MHLYSFHWEVSKLLALGVEGRKQEKERRREMRGLDSITDAMNMNLGKLWETVRTGRAGMLQSMGLQRVRHD